LDVLPSQGTGGKLSLLLDGEKFSILQFFTCYQLTHPVNSFWISYEFFFWFPPSFHVRKHVLDLNIKNRRHKITLWRKCLKSTKLLLRFWSTGGGSLIENFGNFLGPNVSIYTSWRYLEQNRFEDFGRLLTSNFFVIILFCK